MPEISLQLTIISAKGLNKGILAGKMDVYAVVHISGAGNQDRKQKTDVDKDGDCNPTWNHPMKFTIDESAALQHRLSLVVNIKTEGMFGGKDVGEVNIPIMELLDGYSVGGKPLQFVSYQVRKPSGRPKGELSFSYKFGENSAGVGKVEERVTVYPAGKPNIPAAVTGTTSLYPPVYASPVNAAPEIYPPPVAGAGVASGYYPPAGGAYYPPPVGYAQPQAGYDYGYPYQQPAYGGYPPAPAPGYGYAQPQVGYGYGYPYQQPAYGGYPPAPAAGYGGYPPPAGYGYPPVQQPQQPQKNNKLGLGLGAGLLGGALGGLLIGDMV